MSNTARTALAAFQPPGGVLYVVAGVLGVDVTVVGLLVTVTVLVLVDGGGTATVVVTVLTLLVVDDDVAAAEAITAQATRLPASSMAPAPRLPGPW